MELSRAFEAKAIFKPTMKVNHRSKPPSSNGVGSDCNTEIIRLNQQSFMFLGIGDQKLSQRRLVRTNSTNFF